MPPDQHVAWSFSSFRKQTDDAEHVQLLKPNLATGAPQGCVLSPRLTLLLFTFINKKDFLLVMVKS